MACRSHDGLKGLRMLIEGSWIGSRIGGPHDGIIGLDMTFGSSLVGS